MYTTPYATNNRDETRRRITEELGRQTNLGTAKAEPIGLQKADRVHPMNSRSSL